MGALVANAPSLQDARCKRRELLFTEYGKLGTLPVSQNLMELGRAAANLEHDQSHFGMMVN